MIRNAGSTIARASSGSRFAINSVEPLMSANRAVIVLRSPSISSTASPTSCADAPAPESRWAETLRSSAAHWPQNFAVAILSKPHFGQALLSPAPHSLQNLSPSGLSVLQAEHRIDFLNPGTKNKDPSAPNPDPARDHAHPIGRDHEAPALARNNSRVTESRTN